MIREEDVDEDEEEDEAAILLGSSFLRKGLQELEIGISDR